jgi:hypothetical protein
MLQISALLPVCQCRMSLGHTLVKLIAFRIGRGPIRFHSKTVGVKVRWNVTGTGRVPVVPPGSADVVRLLKDGEVLVSQQSLQLDGHAHA